MKRKRKFYLAVVQETHGQYRYGITVRFSTSGDATAVLDGMCKSWYGDGVAADDGYYYNNQEIFISCGQIKEVTEHVYYALEGIVNEYGTENPAPNHEHPSHALLNELTSYLLSNYDQTLWDGTTREILQRSAVAVRTEGN